MPASPDFEPVFLALKKILLSHAASMRVQSDTTNSYCLYAPNPGPNKRPLSFAAVEAKKNYVSFHLVPVYMDPTLLDAVSPDLVKRMQGKGCFNFTSVDADLFRELAELTQRGADYYQRAGYV